MPIFNEQVRKELIDFLSTKLCFSDGELYNHYFDKDCYEDDEWYDEVGMDCEASDWDHGASKIVLFYPELYNWVVKIPLIGDYYEEEDKYNYFENANRNLPIAAKNDYCAAEAFLSEQATTAGLSKMFACTYYLCNIDGVPIYVSEKITNSSWGAEWKNEEDSIKSAKQIKSCCEDEIYDCCINETDLARFIDCYGEDATLDLIAFVSHWRINDLHMGNIMFDKSGNARIIDYSGFNF